MKTDKWLLLIVAYMAFSGAAMGYLGTDESFKFVPATFRFWLIGWFIASNATAIAVKAFYTENKIPDNAPPPKPPEPPVPQPPPPKP